MEYKKCDIQLICLEDNDFNYHVKKGDIIDVIEENDIFYMTDLYGAFSKNRITRGEFKIYEEIIYEIY